MICNNYKSMPATLNIICSTDSAHNMIVHYNYLRANIYRI